MDNPLMDFIVNAEDRFIKLEAKLQKQEKAFIELEAKFIQLAQLSANFSKTTSEVITNLLKK